MHAIEEELPCGELEFAAQATLCVPPGHHSSGGQAWQSPPSGPAKPAAHLQSVTAPLPSAEDENSVHSFCTPPKHHAPAGHTAQLPPAGPKYPGTHTQSLRDELPAEDELASEGQEVQVEDPAATEYVPSEHSSHEPHPVCSLNQPEPHAVHALPLAPVYPARHVQLLNTVLPSIELVLAGHAMHCENECAAMISE
jgi:hypothetical protein